MRNIFLKKLIIFGIMAFMILDQEIFAQTSLQDRINAGQSAYAQGCESGKKSDFSLALTLFQEVRKDQDAPYSVQLEMTAAIIRTHLALGQDIEAVSEFLLLCQTDYSVLFIDDVPLFWTDQYLGTVNARLKTLEQIVLPWLEPIENPSQKWNPVAQLLAASVLLHSVYRERAVQTLRTLVVLESPDPDNSQMVEFCRKISLLATAQLWRLKLREPDLSSSEVDFWHRTLERFPDSLKYGPCFLIGNGYRKSKAHEDALDAFLRVFILAPEKKTLANAALMTAIDELESLEQNREADILRKEWRTRYSNK